MSPRVLVVDDEPDVVELLSYNFRSAGAEVRSAGDGPQAVAAATSWLPDAIVLDLDLPFLDGLSVCEMLRKMPAMRTTPILMLTGWSSSQTQQLAAEAGGTAFMTKPFSPHEVVKRVLSLADD
jgi:DNA-binding response OmpR family regulator